MLKWRLKACVRCSGDLYIDRDMDGWFEQCLQCSFRRELRELQLKKQPVGVGGGSINWDENED